ncbi:MAG: Uma2 family endonuclease [Polyangiaceae bacterium]
MAADAARRRATYEDLLAAPPYSIAEIVDGDLVVQPRPAGPHAHAASGLGMDIGGPFDRGRGGPGGWLIVDEPELHLHDDVLVPDLAGWRRERLPDLTGAHFTLAPDWVCEVLSPRTTHYDRGPKADIYAREGVGHLWFVDPDAKLIEAFALADGRWSRLGAWLGDDDARIPPFDAVALEPKLLWIPETPETK